MSLSLFLEPRFAPGVALEPDRMLLLVFVLAGVLIVASSAGMYRALERSRRDRDLARAANEELARHAEGKFRAVFDSDVVPLQIARTDGQITDANDAFLRLVGRSRDELDPSPRRARPAPSSATAGR